MPLQSPLAEHEVEFTEDQLSVIELPTVIEESDEEKELITGLGLLGVGSAIEDPPPPPPPHDVIKIKLDRIIINFFIKKI